MQAAMRRQCWAADAELGGGGGGTALLPQLDACTHHAAAKRLLQHALPHLPHLAATTQAAASCAPPSPAPPQLTRAFERG